MESVLPTDVLFENAARRERAKERLYVICQSCGWLFFLALQLVFIFALSSKDKPGRDDPLLDAGIITMVIMQGWLITHYTRPLIARWGWKSLGWRALLPSDLRLARVQFACCYTLSACRPSKLE